MSTITISVKISKKQQNFQNSLIEEIYKKQTKQKEKNNNYSNKKIIYIFKICISESSTKLSLAPNPPYNVNLPENCPAYILNIKKRKRIEKQTKLLLRKREIDIIKPTRSDDDDD